MSCRHAIILAGGRSQRFGSDKLRHAVDGVPMLARVIAACRDAGLDALVVGRLPATGEDWRGIADARPGLGPLGGLATGLSALAADAVLLAGDLPFLAADDLRWLLAADAGAPLGTVVRTDAGLEPCFAIYRPAALPLAEAALARDQRALHRLCSAPGFAIVDAPAAVAGRLRNINRPADLG